MTNKCELPTWFELNRYRTVADVVFSECSASQFCYAPCDSYSVGSVQVRSQPKGVKPKMRGRKLRSPLDWQGVLKQKA
jgi:hypothetical protein